MAFTVNLSFFILWTLVLVISGYLLVRTLVVLGKFLKINEFLLGFIIMAIFTSLPELFVGVNAALANNGALSLGNVIGSNIVNLTLVAGLTTVLARRISANNKAMRHNSLLMAAMASLPIILMFTGNSLSRTDGIILLLAFGGYIYYLIKQHRSKKKFDDDHIGHWKGLTSSGIFIISLIALFVSSEFVVEFGSAVATDLSLAPIFFGLFFIAIGTSLPELIFGINAVLSHHSQLAVNDIMGSVVANATLVLGITALIAPISANFLLFLSSGVFMIVVAFLFATFVHSGRKLYLMEGISMVLLYVLFLIVEFNLHQYFVVP